VFDLSNLESVATLILSKINKEDLSGKENVAKVTSVLEDLVDQAQKEERQEVLGE